MKGRTNDRLTAGMPHNTCWSMMDACSGGKMEPPKMAIIKPAAPNFASSPKPFKAMP